MGLGNKNETKPTPFSEEDVCVVSKADTCLVWAGTKILYSGNPLSGTGQASGFQYWSGESDVEAISHSGWGNIRIPELNQLHKIFVFPRLPCVHAVPDYLTLTVGNPSTSGYPTGTGGCSGKVALLHYGTNNLSGVYPYCTWYSGLQFNSGLIDVIAFGSIY